MPITYIYIYICMHTIKVYHQWGQFLSEQYIPEIRTILLHLLYFLIRFEYCYIIINDYVCACVWLLLLMTLCYKNKEFQLPAVQFFIHQSPFCYMPLGQMRVVYTKELYYCYVKYFQLKKKRLSLNMAPILAPSFSLLISYHLHQWIVIYIYYKISWFNMPTYM